MIARTSARTTTFARLRRPAAAALALALVALLPACSADGDSAERESASALLARAKRVLDATPSAHFTLASDDVPDVGAALLGGQGELARPGKFRGSLDVSFGGGTAKVGVVSVDGTVYAKLPFASSYVVTDPAQFGFADPGTFMDPDTGLSNLLTRATEARFTGKARIGPDVVRIVQAQIPGETVADLLASADPTQPVDAVFSVVAGNGELRRAVVTGPFFRKDTASTYTITLNRYGDEVDIRAPSTG